MVTVEVPAAAVPATLSVKVLPLVELAGLNEAATPEGRPLALKATVPVKPLAGVSSYC